MFPFFVAWSLMLLFLLATYAAIPVARSPAEHPSWWLAPIRSASLLMGVVGGLVVIGLYALLSRSIRSLRRPGMIVYLAAVIGGIASAIFVFASEPADAGAYENALGTAGQVSAAILIAFVIERRWLSEVEAAGKLDIVGFAFIATSMGTAILGLYPLGDRWQAALMVVTGMGASSGLAAVALKSGELSELLAAPQPQARSRRRR